MHITVCNEKRKQNSSEKDCFWVPQKPEQCYSILSFWIKGWSKHPNEIAKEFKIHPGWTMPNIMHSQIASATLKSH